MIGPNLYGVLGRKVASHEGYEYSDALKAKGDETWDYEKINHMIENPGAYVPGTKMALFPGLPERSSAPTCSSSCAPRTTIRRLCPRPTPEATPSARRRTERRKPGEAAGGDAAFLELIAKADPKQGEADTGVCKVCHKFDKGGGTLMGPDLYGVVGRKIASVEGFNYTPALKAHEGDWTYEKLDSWLKNPQAFAPGTAMAFPGVADDKKRAAIVAFLRTNAETPVPLPEAAAATPAAAPAAEPAAPPAETPAPPSAETPAPSAETPRHRRPRTPAPAAETPAPPAAETPAPSAETPAPPAETPAPPAAETPPPSAETRLRPRRLRLPLKHRRLRQPRRRHRRLRHLRRRRPRPRQRRSPRPPSPSSPSRSKRSSKRRRTISRRSLRPASRPPPTSRSRPIRKGSPRASNRCWNPARKARPT